jgi:hypothetical protein
MERTLTSELSASLPRGATDAHGLSVPRPAIGPLGLVRRLLPLWRHVAFLGALFGIAGAGAMVRLEVQQLRKDLDRTQGAILDARVLNDRLILENEARHRVMEVERAATEHGLSASARIETIPAAGGAL